MVAPYHLVMTASLILEVRLTGEGPAGDRAGDAGMGGANGNDRDGAGVW